MQNIKGVHHMAEYSKPLHKQYIYKAYLYS